MSPAINMKSLVIVGFGSSSQSLRARTFDPIEKEAAEEFPDRTICRGFIGKEVLERILSRGIEAQSWKKPWKTAFQKGPKI